MNKLKPTIPFFLLSAALLAGCAVSSTGKTASASNSTAAISSASIGSSVSISSDNVTGDFSIVTEDGAYSHSGSVYTITSAGTYTLSGKLTGQIYVAASDSDAVELDLNGVSITYGENSPVFVESADEVKVKAVNGTENFVTDTRAEQSADSDTQGGGALYAKTDMSIVGKGSLTVKGTYNNGVHTTKDLKIKNLTLTSTAPNNAIKGNDSLTIKSGTITAISSEGDALKTSSTDLNNSSEQRGDLTISGGEVTLYSGCDGIDAAYNANVVAGTDDEGNAIEPNITIYTNKYSSYSDSSVLASYDGLANYTAYGPGGHQMGPGGGNPGGTGPGGDAGNTDKADGSAKGIKAANAINISAGSLSITAYDDGIHANSGDTFDSGAKGVGAVNISGGSVSIACSDDGIHADGTLTISDGTVSVGESHEGLEGNNIYITGGTSIAYAEDDAVNASTLISVSDGYLFACVPSSGDTDGIDSNGSYRQTGGTVITCGPNNMNSAAIDVDNSVSVSGGTFAAFGYLSNMSSSLKKSTLSGFYGNKAYTLTFDSGSVVTQKLTSSYSSLTVYSELGSVKSCA